MSSSLNKTINKIVKQTAVDVEWCERTSSISNYNDERKADRRLSYMRNGWRLPKKMKQNMLSQIKEKINQNCDLKSHVRDIHWIESFRYGYGAYDKLVVIVNK